VLCRHRYILIATLLGISLPGCTRQTASPRAVPAEVVAANPLRAPIIEWDEYVGRLDAIEFVEVRARVSGYLDSIHFKEGQIVRENDLLCVIDPRPFVVEVNRTDADVAASHSQVVQAKATVVQVESEVKVAEARFDLAGKQYDRFKRLLAQKVATQDEYDVQESEVTQSRANLEAVRAKLGVSQSTALAADATEDVSKALRAIARLNLDYTEVHAPIAGRISSRLVTEGNLISGGTAQSTIITTIVSLDPIHCTFDADEQSFLKYVRLSREGKRQSSRVAKTPVFVGLADEANTFPHHGHMDFVDNRMDLETGTMRGRAILPNPDMTLTPGLFTRLRFPGSARYEAVLIPDLAVGTDQSEKFVFVIESDNTARRQLVEPGPMVRGLRVIRKGLDGTERIVVRGLQRVRPGEAVTATIETIALVDDGLPDDAEPVPEDQWLSRPTRSANKTGTAPPAVP
jgi:RND family efflux transporter MFP subunit